MNEKSMSFVTAKEGLCVVASVGDFRERNIGSKRRERVVIFFFWKKKDQNLIYHFFFFALKSR